MPPSGPDHAGLVDELGDVLKAALGGRAIVRTQSPLVLASGSEPEPDLARVRRRDDYYRSGHLTAADVLLVIEIADSTLQYDREIKAPLYAEDAIPEFWPVNLVDGVVVYREPSSTRYRSVKERRRGDSIRPLAFPDVAISVSDVLGAQS